MTDDQKRLESVISRLRHRVGYRLPTTNPTDLEVLLAVENMIEELQETATTTQQERETRREWAERLGGGKYDNVRAAVDGMVRENDRLKSDLNEIGLAIARREIELQKGKKP